jgi:hypothetical protein
MLVSLGSGPVAVDLYYKVKTCCCLFLFQLNKPSTAQAQGIFSRMGIIDKVLDAIVQKLAAQVNDQVNEGLAKSRRRNT